MANSCEHAASCIRPTGINADGIINLMHEGPAYNPETAFAVVAGVGDTVTGVFEFTDVQGIDTGALPTGWPNSDSGKIWTGNHAMSVGMVGAAEMTKSVAAEDKAPKSEISGQLQQGGCLGDARPFRLAARQQAFAPSHDNSNGAKISVRPTFDHGNFCNSLMQELHNSVALRQNAVLPTSWIRKSRSTLIRFE